MELKFLPNCEAKLKPSFETWKLVEIYSQISEFTWNSVSLPLKSPVCLWAAFTAPMLSLLSWGSSKSSNSIAHFSRFEKIITIMGKCKSANSIATPLALRGSKQFNPLSLGYLPLRLPVDISFWHEERPHACHFAVLLAFVSSLASCCLRLHGWERGEQDECSQQV